MQVVIGGPYSYYNAYIAGNYDNIEVASDIATSMTYMNSTLHNGSFTAQAYGYWYNTPNAIPTGWVEMSQYMYTTTGMWIQAGSAAEAICNTGERVIGNHQFTVQADLGGGAGTDATVRVYATQNADGTGDKQLLVSVNRLGQADDGYNLFTVSNTGTGVPSSFDGYYVQVVIAGPYSYANHYLAGNYDNIIVTSEVATSMTYMNSTLHNGSFTYGPDGLVGAGYWHSTESAVPTGWQEITAYNYTTAMRWIQCGSAAEAVCNTGELIIAGHQFKVSADLGGGDGVDATVRVFATEYADGTGTKVQVASVHRLGQATDGYNLFNVEGELGATVPPNLAGYFVQVAIGGPYVDHYISGNYDNIVVTSVEGLPITSITYMDAMLHNGDMESLDVSGSWNDHDYDANYIPYEWKTLNTPDANHIWTAALGFIIFDGTRAGVVNNTGEKVYAGQYFTVSARLGGRTGALAQVLAYATQNADGTGNKVLLAQVSRPGNDANGYSLYTVNGDAGPVTISELANYYVQVMCKTVGDVNLGGYYDDIVVTSHIVEGATCGDASHPYPDGDLNSDCYVNYVDVKLFSEQWLATGCVIPGWCGGADLSEDTYVKFDDFAVLAETWMDCTDPNPPCSYNP
ncbi:MAG: hypothetical protein A2Y12_18855 [Planctomycetes bacterium GWF2_42_9]|nr:MAG: hypothetical protein A2Y12_18855 [Planctomycetes bacterium GWF2_42_9]